MKNKKKIYILVPLVIIIWGVIFYRIFSHLHKNDDNPDNNIFVADTGSLKKVHPDDIVLVKHYPDPFLKSSFRPRPISEPEKPVNRIRREATNRQRFQPKENVQWPDITYRGIIENEKSNKLTILITISNQTMLMQESDEKNGVMVLRAYPDSIQVKFKEEQKTILKD